MQVQRYQGVALLLHLANQAKNLFFMQQQLFDACGVWVDVGRSCFQRVDLTTNQEQLPFFDDHIAIRELYLTLS